MTEHKHEYMKKYRAEHKDSIKENQKKYYLSHKELYAFKSPRFRSYMIFLSKGKMSESDVLEENEILFLLCLSDNLHNVPEFAELFIKTAKMIEDCESEDEISKLIKSTKENFLLKLVTERLQKTVGIIRNKEERNSLEIKDNNHIIAWCYELNALSSSCEIFYTQLEEFIRTGGQEK